MDKDLFCGAKGIMNLNVQECSLYLKREVKADVSDKRLKESEKNKIFTEKTR